MSTVASTPSAAAADSGARSVNAVLAQSQVEPVMDELQRDLVGLAPVKARVRDIAALLVERVDIGTDGMKVRLRLNGLAALAHEMLAEVGAAA